MKKLKIALIGAGGIATNAHAPAYEKMDNVEIAGVCDIIEERAKLTPLSTIMAEKITSLRLWAKNRARIAGDEFVEKIEGEDSIVRLKTECYNPLLG